MIIDKIWEVKLWIVDTSSWIWFWIWENVSHIEVECDFWYYIEEYDLIHITLFWYRIFMSYISNIERIVENEEEIDIV